MPGNVTTLTRITGNLTISGAISPFPNFAALDIVEGNLTINDIPTRTLTDLSDIFPALDSVYGILQIQNQNVVETITGFASLDSVGGGISIINNTSLRSIPPFDALKGVEGGITIRDNAALRTISGFATLQTIVGSVGIHSNALLTSVSDFPVVTSIQGDLNFRENLKLTTLSIFPKLKSIDANLRIGTNIVLNAVSGFGSLETVGNDFIITNNILLATLPTFATLTRVERDFLVLDNAKLATLSGFGVLATVGRNFTFRSNVLLTSIPTFATITSIGNNFTVTGNTALSECCGLLRLVDNTVVPGGMTDISGNGTGCSTSSEITNTCFTELTINSDEDIPSNVTRITRIRGNLTIGGTITTFPDFSNLTLVEGNLVISGLTNGSPIALDRIFPLLSEVKGDLLIQNNGTVKTITGFTQLNRIGGTLLIQTHSALTHLPSFNALNTATGVIGISQNNVLSASPSFSSLTTTAGVTISNNTALNRILGFNSLTDITNMNLVIENNSTLTTVSGFDVLETITGNLSIRLNTQLPTLPTFNALTSVADISIMGNSALTSILGFGSLTTIGSNLSIQGNTSLSLCCGLLSVANGTLVPTSTLTISGNASGCSSKIEITNTCTASLTIDDPADVTATLSTLVRITGDLTIGGTITTFPDFAALRVVEGNITIRGITTNTLADLNNIFAALENVGKTLTIDNNEFVESLSGFGALETVGNDFILTDNILLATLPTFATITRIGNDFTVTGNTVLSGCCDLHRLIDEVVTGSTITISGNAAGCSNKADITTNCGASPTTLATLLIDDDSDIPSNVTEVTRITGDLTIRGLATAVPDFAALKVVEGNVTINNIRDILFNLADIFPVLDSIRGNFVIENTPSEELSGLEELDSIGGNLHILSNSMSFLPEFAELDKIGGSVNISGNQNLIDCCGLLKFLDGSVSPAPSTTISNNSTGCNTPTEITNTCLFSVEIKADADIPADMSTIKKIVGNLSIEGSLTNFPTFPALEVVEGNIGIFSELQTPINNLFPALDSVRGGLFISGNSQTISGLEELDSIGGSLFISDNTQLTTPPSFSNLKFIEKGLTIAENSALTALPSFAALTRIGGGVVISNNAQLTDCCGIRPFTASALLQRNGTGCNSVNEIESDCGAVEPVLGLPTLAQHLRFYPNPASQTLYIEGISQETALFIRTLSGKTLLRATLSQNEAVDLTALPQGTYILTLQNAQEQLTRRLVVGF